MVRNTISRSPSSRSTRRRERCIPFSWGLGSPRALLADGTTLYVSVQSRIVALDAPTGSLLPFDLPVSFAVEAMEKDGNSLYVGGFFTSVGGQDRASLAEIDVSTGSVTSWNPGVSGSSGSVSELAVTPSAVYISGAFTTAGGAARRGLAAIDRTTGTATAFDVQLTPPSEPGSRGSRRRRRNRVLDGWFRDHRRGAAFVHRRAGRGHGSGSSLESRSERAGTPWRPARGWRCGHRRRRIHQRGRRHAVEPRRGRPNDRVAHALGARGQRGHRSTRSPPTARASTWAAASRRSLASPARTSERSTSAHGDLLPWAPGCFGTRLPAALGPHRDARGRPGDTHDLRRRLFH